MIVRAVLVMLIATCSTWWFSHTITRTWLYPIWSGFLVGLVMGQPLQGMMIAAAINLPYVGFITAGGSMPGNPQFAGPVGTALALVSGMDLATATTVGTILASVGVFLWQVYMTVNATWVHMADGFMAKGNLKMVRFCNYVPSFFVSLIINGLPAFLVVTQGQAFADVLMAMPAWVMDIFAVAGGILPALGIGMLLNYLSKPKLFPFFLIGFFLTEYLGIPTMGIAILGAMVALLMYNFNKKEEIENA